MMLKQYQIDLILDLRQRLRMGVEAIAKKTGHSKNTVKKYLTLYGLLNYTYSPYQGGPSLVSPSQTGSYTPQQEIDDLMQRGGRLIKKLDETFVSLDKANEKIEALTSELNTEKEQSNTQIMQLKHDLEKADEREQNLTTENKKLTEITTQQATKIEGIKLEKDGLQKTVNEQKDVILNMKQDHQRELETEKTKIEGEKNNEILRIKKESLYIQQELNSKLTTAEKEKNLLTKNYQIISNERNTLKNIVRRLEMKQKNAPIITIIVGVTCLGGGIATGWWLRGRNKNPTSPVRVYYGKKIATPVIPILQEWISQPNIHYTNSGETPEITPSLTLCSGAIFTHSGENTSIGYNIAPSQQKDMFPHDIQGNDRGVTPVTSISGILSPGAFSPGSSVFPNQSDVIQPNTHSEMTTGTDTPGDQCSNSNNSQENACIGSTFIPNQTDAVMPSDTNNDVTFVTRVSGDQSLGIYCSSHFDIGFTSQEAPAVQIPSPFQIPLNYIPYIPFPTFYNDISEIYPMKQLRRLKGIPFEIYIEKLFVHKGCPTERTPYGNYSGDQIGTLNGVPTLIECKQKPIVRVDTIQRTRGAMEDYRDKGVTHCMVITTGEFTKDAREEAQKIGVELWDGKRLLEEIYKDQFFYLPENPEDYDPNK